MAPLYRSTLCVSAVFAVARCLSVTLMHCIVSAEDIVKLLFQPGSPIIHFLTPPSAGTQFKGESLLWGRKIHGWEIFAIFDRNRRLSRKR